MPSGAIVKGFNVGKQSGLSNLASGIARFALGFDFLSFEGSEERFSNGIIKAITFT